MLRPNRKHIRIFSFVIVCFFPFCAFGQFVLPVSIGETKGHAMKKLEHYNRVTISASMRKQDSTGGERIDSAYDGVRFQGIQGRLFITFSREIRPLIIGLHWESAVKYKRALNILHLLKKHYGGTIDTSASPTWWSQSPRVLREAIIYQHDLAYRESILDYF